MTLIAFYCRDGENGAALRERLRADHLAHIETHIDDFALAGPLKDGDEIIGSLVIIKAEDETEARARFEADPYYIAGVWQSIRASRFEGIAGDWVGGKAWQM